MLDKQSLKILKFIKANVRVTLEQLKTAFPTIPNIQSCLNLLLELNYISGTEVQQYTTASTIFKDTHLSTRVIGPYSITPSGRAYLESLETQEDKEAQEAKENKKINRRENLNTLLAAIALVVAIIALFCD